jgi:hypothetical protein
MGIRGNILEMACESTASLDWSRMIEHLNGATG